MLALGPCTEELVHFKRYKSVRKRGCKCVCFFCVWLERGESGGGGGERRGGGDLGGSEAPDADPLKKNKGGRQQKNVLNRS